MKRLNKYMMAAAAALVLAPAARASRGEISHEPFFVANGQTYTGDVSTDRSVTVDGTLDGDAVAVNGSSLTINGEVTGDVVGIGGPARITGAVQGDVTEVGSVLEIDGKVNGDVNGIGCAVKLLENANVSGDVSVLGGTVLKSPGAKLSGNINAFDLGLLRTVLPRVMRYGDSYSYHRRSEHLEYWHNPWLVGGLVGVGLMIFFSMLVTGVILLLIPAVFFPSSVERGAALIRADIWKACGVGALMVVGFFPGLLMLTVSVLGIPLIPFALLLYGAAAVLGLSAFSVVLQRRFFEGIKRQGPKGLAGQVASGYALMAGLMFFGKIIPLAGGILSLIGFMLIVFGTMLGLGAAWLTRMGSRAYPPVPAVPAQGYPAPVVPGQVPGQPVPQDSSQPPAAK